MPTGWSGLKPIPKPQLGAKSPKLNEKAYGVYKIIAISKEKPICFPRLGGIDEEGILYIGRSGGKDGSSGRRTLASRLKEFVQVEKHSGGEAYALTDLVGHFSKGIFSGKNELRYQCLYLSGNKEEIEEEEKKRNR